jgi:hypothetical protein
VTRPRNDPFLQAVLHGPLPRATASSATAPRRRGGFDGGCRQPLPQPPPTHDQFLVELLRTRAADVGRHL